MSTVVLSGRRLSTDWQQLDLSQLQHNFVQSIWYLHSQPPLFNATIGFLLKLPAQLRTPTAVFVGLALGLGIALCSYYLCLELHVPSWAAFVVSALVVLDPASVFYQNLFFYTYLTTFGLVFAALCGARYLRKGRGAWGAGYFGCLAGVLLLNSSFQWPWLLVVAAPVMLVFRRRWRSVLVIALVPILCVTVWYAKNAIVFHTYTTSSWVGMNLARITTEEATPRQLQTLMKAGKITPVSGIIPFSAGPKAYGPKFSSHPRTGVPVLDDLTKSDGSINLNNVNFIAISNEYLHNDLQFIEAYPGSYARAVVKATHIFFVPCDQYVAPITKAISGYAHVYDLLVNWQPASTHTGKGSHAAATGSGPSLAQISWSTVLEWLVTLLLAPLLAWRRRHDLPYALTLGFIWMTALYLFVVTNFVEIGENNRFRFDMGPLPLIATVAVVVAAIEPRRATALPSSPPVNDEPHLLERPVVDSTP